MQIEIAPYELSALIDYHLDLKRTCSNKEEYLEAEEHRKRALELAKLLPDGRVPIPHLGKSDEH